MAVSKTQPVWAVREALEAGCRLFGENRVQEAGEKFPSLRADFPDIELHLIGPLQTNKARRAVRLFDVIETLDRPSLAAHLARLRLEGGPFPRLYLEVNIGQEPQKAGLLPKEVPAFLARCRTEWKLEIEGLMAIPPASAPPAPFFAQLQALAAQTGLARLSMGMSDDFETAIAYGSTQVRLGSALFGARKKQDKSELSG